MQPPRFSSDAIDSDFLLSFSTNLPEDPMTFFFKTHLFRVFSETKTFIHLLSEISVHMFFF